MRRVGRTVVALFSIVVLLAALYGAVMAVRWADSETGFGLLDRRPEQPLAFSSLNKYTKEAAARPSFRRYFTTMVVSAPEAGATDAPVVTKWERPRVVIKLLNSGGPGIRTLPAAAGRAAEPHAGRGAVRRRRHRAAHHHPVPDARRLRAHHRRRQRGQHAHALLPSPHPA